MRYVVADIAFHIELFVVHRAEATLGLERRQPHALPKPSRILSIHTLFLLFKIKYLNILVSITYACLMVMCLV